MLPSEEQLRILVSRQTIASFSCCGQRTSDMRRQSTRRDSPLRMLLAYTELTPARPSASLGRSPRVDAIPYGVPHVMACRQGWRTRAPGRWGVECSVGIDPAVLAPGLSDEVCWAPCACVGMRISKMESSGEGLSSPFFVFLARAQIKEPTQAMTLAGHLGRPPSQRSVPSVCVSYCP